jgi:DNA-binding transcriptional LysR family regulator
MQSLPGGEQDITLTPFGPCLRKRVRSTVNRPTLPFTSRDRSPKTISFGVNTEVGEIIVSFLANAFHLRWPNARLVIMEGRGSTLEEWVTHRHVDVAILDETSKLPELQLIPALRDKFGLIASVHSEIGEDVGPLSLRELGRLPLILPREQHWFRRRLDQIARRRGVQLFPALEVDGVAMITSLVRSDVGFSILPRSVVQTEVARAGLAFRPITQPSLTCNSSIAFHRSASGTFVATFAEMIRLAITTYALEGAWPTVKLITA